MQVHILERILFDVIACTVILVGLYLYTYLVSIYQSGSRHWPHVLVVLVASDLGGGPASPTTSCISHARWTQQLDRGGQSAAFQLRLASFALPAGAGAGATGGLETSRSLLSLQNRHASGIIVYFNQSRSASASASAAAAAAAIIEVRVEAFYESEEAPLRAETRTILYVRCGGQVRVDTAASGSLRHEYDSARDDISLEITVWLRRAAPCAVETRGVPLTRSQCVVDDSPPHAIAFGSQRRSMPLMNAPAFIEVDTINMPHRYVREKCSNDVLEPAATAVAGFPTYTNNNGLPFSIIFTTTDAQVTRRIYPADSKTDGFFHVSTHSLNNPLVIRFFGQTPGEALDLGVSPTSDLETVPLPCMGAPFELMVTTIRPSVGAELRMEEPTGCMKSRIVRHGNCLKPDVE